MSTPSDLHDPYAGQYPLPKKAVTTTKYSNEPFYMVDPYNSTATSHPASFHSYNDSRSSQAYIDPRSSQIYNISMSSQRYNDSRSSQKYSSSNSRSSQTYNNNSRSSSLPSTISDHFRRSESTVVVNNNNSQSIENMKFNYYDPEAISLREYLEAERKEKLRIQKEIEMERRYSQPSKLDTFTNKMNSNVQHPKRKRQNIKDEKFEYKKTYSTRSILGMVLLVFFLLIGVGLIVAEKLIASQCHCDTCIECSNAFHQGLLYSGVGVLCVTGFIFVFKMLRKICC